MGDITPRPAFNWWSVIERGLWTGVQLPSVAGVLDVISEGVEIPGLNYLWLALGGVLVSMVKTVAQERLHYLDTRRG